MTRTSVRLRPVTEQDLHLLESMEADPVEASEFGFYGFRSTNKIRRDYLENGMLGADSGLLVVEADGELVGSVGWHRTVTAPICATLNFGIGLLSSARGRGYGTAAQWALAEYLFGYTQANRLEAGTETENLAEQRSLEKAGFTREGVQRGACFRAGRWRDMVVYAMVRADFEALSRDRAQAEEAPVAAASGS